MKLPKDATALLEGYNQGYKYCRMYWPDMNEELLENVETHEMQLNHLNGHGTPGNGLRKALRDYSKEDSRGILVLDNPKYSEEYINAGIAGERALFQLIKNSRLYATAEVFFSVAYPEPSQYEYADVDCIIVSGSIMYLIDAKMYRVNPNAAYSTPVNDQIHLSDNSGHLLRKYPVSLSMLHAREAFQNAYPKYDVQPVIALCPTSNGNPAVYKQSCLYDCIPLVQAKGFISAFRRRDTRPPVGDSYKSLYDLLIH